MYRYEFEKYTGQNSKYTCPKCGKRKTFVRYVDIETGKHLHPSVGRCDRESKCGYHLTPKEYGTGNLYTDFTPPPPPPTNYMKKIDVLNSMNNYNHNNFIQFLYSKFNKKDVDNIIKKYGIGTHGNYVVFWLIDNRKRVRTGKCMLYNKTTGKRIKNKINWMHKQPYQLDQCFFGEHLIIDNNKPIAIVESEKTAIICDLIFGKYIWIASGGKSNLTAKKLKILHNKKVILFPDNDGLKKWSEFGLKTSTMLHDIDNGSGLDLADLVLKSI